MGFGGEGEDGEGGEDGCVEAAGGGGGVVVEWEEEEVPGAVVVELARVVTALAVAEDVAGVEVEGEYESGDGEENDDGDEHNFAAKLEPQRISDVAFFSSWDFCTVTISSHFGSLSLVSAPAGVKLKAEG